LGAQEYHAVPTRRSSDLHSAASASASGPALAAPALGRSGGSTTTKAAPPRDERSSASEPPCSVTISRVSVRPRPVPFSLVVKKGDRKSTRLNSSHVKISY